MLLYFSNGLDCFRLENCYRIIVHSLCMTIVCGGGLGRGVVGWKCGGEGGNLAKSGDTSDGLAICLAVGNGIN